jgi:hypothetical protein
MKKIGSGDQLDKAQFFLKPDPYKTLGLMGRFNSPACVCTNKKMNHSLPKTHKKYLLLKNQEYPPPNPSNPNSHTPQHPNTFSINTTSCAYF